jgi:hypothetical protein
MEERLNIYQTSPEGKRLLGSLLVLHASHGSTRLGFELSSDVVIVREEIDDAKPRVTEAAR